MVRHYSLILAVMLAAIGARAQELEYKMELGGMVGASYYMGDANLAPYHRVTPAVSAIARYNINPRMALKGNIGWATLKGDVADRDAVIPARQGQSREFSNALIDVSCQLEASFFGYGMGSGYKGHRRLAPYIQGGLGFTHCNSALTMHIPLGVGVKYKLMNRLNAGADITYRFTFSDKLDGIADPYKIESGTLKNKDTYSWTMIYITYDMFPKYRKCNND